MTIIAAVIVWLISYLPSSSSLPPTGFTASDIVKKNNGESNNTQHKETRLILSRPIVELDISNPSHATHADTAPQDISDAAPNHSATLKSEEKKEDLEPQLEQNNNHAETHQSTSDVNSHDRHEEISEPIITSEYSDDANFYEQSNLGDIPIKREKDQMSIFDRYKIPYQPKSGARGIISIGITDVGLGKNDVQELVKAEIPISAVFSPYAADLQKKIDELRAHHVEPWMGMPIEDSEFPNNDSGPYSLISGLNDDQNGLRLMAVLSSSKHYVGLAFINTPNFTNTQNGLGNIFAQLEARGIPLAAAGGGDTISPLLAQNYPKLSLLKGAVWLDAAKAEADFTQDLRNIEQIALTQGAAMVFMPMQPKAFAALKEWKKNLDQTQIDLAPLSAIKIYSN